MEQKVESEAGQNRFVLKAGRQWGCVEDLVVRRNCGRQAAAVGRYLGSSRCGKKRREDLGMSGKGLGWGGGIKSSVIIRVGPSRVGHPSDLTAGVGWRPWRDATL